MDKFQVSILEYLGKLESGIMVLLSITYNNNYYECTYFYTDKDIVLTATQELEEEIGHKITEDDNYKDLIKSIIKMVVPYKEIYGRLDDIDFRRWMVEHIEESESED